jgi:S-formylglutathione hydrolase FrmB
MPRLASCLLVVWLTITPTARPDQPAVRFSVTYSPEVNPGPISTRVYVMLGPAASNQPPRMGPNWFNPQPFFAVEAHDWKPGEPLAFDDRALGFPGALSTLKPGDYAAQAVVRLNPDTRKLGDGEGNAFGPVVTFTIDAEKPLQEPVALTVDQINKPQPFRETDRVKLVELDSPILSAFYKRPIKHRAAVILPPGEAAKTKVPTLYIVPGFGGDHRMAHIIARGGYANYGRDFLRVVLDPDCGTGHHVFADSATNGPRGQALVEELIPHIEKTFPAIPEPNARLLTGHSSGGWSSLWLQVTYPEFFGGTWSTSPDPVDFRDFQRIDLYADGENMYRDREGNRRPIARQGNRPVIWYDTFSKLEEVMGDGGQLRSFEAVFSPLDAEGRPRCLWDRQTGAIDPVTARSWEKYDIRLVLERNWDSLKPKLAGKLHVYMGDMDTFYLEGATRLLKQSLETLGSDAVVELFPGRDHGNLLGRDLVERIDQEMHTALSQKYPDIKPAAAAR